MLMSRNSIFVHSPDQLPKGEHWAIIEGTSVSIPGDERSRTNPGHGYPAHTEDYITYEAFTDKAEFEMELERRLTGKYASFYHTVTGIHVSGVYQPKTRVEFTETK